MRALVVYESIYGNTHTVAEGIAVGLRPEGDVRVVSVGDATNDLVRWADLVVVGAPTHIHGMTRSSSRKSAIDNATRSGGTVTLDPAADGPGVRDWLRSVEGVRDKRAAAFDTRLPGPAVFTGRASGGIVRGLRRHGFSIAGKPQSFLVGKDSRLIQGETERAVRWGAELASELVPVD